MDKSNVTQLHPKDKGSSDETFLGSSLSPREIVSELDRFVVGQNKAKKAVAVALRNRWRRQALKGEMKNEVLPKNILMIGPTGVGKTEISRRLSKLAEAPFIKVEATRFTEVGYVGRDVEQIIRDLIEIAIALRWLERNPQDVVEVGAVMPYYQDVVKHEIIDPYDPRATIRDFMENQDLMLMNVLCISTIEHIGTTDYATNERQNIVDKNAAINALKQILDDGENCLISIPIGYNHFLDSWLEENLDILNCFAYKKVLWTFNNNLGHTITPNGNGELHIRTDTPDGVKSLWSYYEDVKSIKGERYREPFPAGNYVLFIEGWK